ncbi:MAG: asparagine synthase-related protein [Anaerolineae bacterium]|nr:asparagine synthase-related protein [Anaerolineae bacterium]
MSAIIAILPRRSQVVTRDSIRPIIEAAPHRSVDGYDIWADHCIALGHQHFDLTPEGHGEVQPQQYAGGHIVITCDARLDNREELQRRLNRQSPSPTQPSDTELIVAAYQKWGVACVDYLLGDFAFALWDATTRQLFVARDPLGTRDVAYYLDSEICVVASEVKQVVAHPHVPRRINDLKIAMVLVSWWHDHVQTCFEDVYYLPPAHAMLVSAETHRIWRYWDIDPEYKIRYRDDREYADHFLTLLRQSLADRLRVRGPVGVSLSGGIDSVTLAVLAAQQLPRNRLKTFSYVFDRYPSCDERAYIQPVVDQYDLDATFLPGDDLWPLSNSKTWPVYSDFPTQDPYVRLPQAIMQAAQASGIHLLLNGHYADLLLVGGRYWAAGMLSDPRQWANLVGHIRRGPSAAMLREDVWQKGVRQLFPPSWQRRWRGRYSPLRQVAYQHVSTDLIRRTGLEDVLDLYADRPAFSTTQALTRYNHSFLSIEEQGTSAHRVLSNAHGVEIVDPFRDRRLIAFCLALPSHQLERPSHTKWLLRQGMDAQLPQHVCWRRDKTSLLAQFEDALLRLERDTVHALLDRPCIVEHNYVRGDWQRQEAAAGKNWQMQGYLLWLCVTMELWLQNQS